MNKRVDLGIGDEAAEGLINEQSMGVARATGGSSPSRMMVLRSCLNCHAEVHGSNHPSGPRLAR